jgi:hypothetical protein
MDTRAIDIYNACEAGDLETIKDFFNNDNNDIKISISLLPLFAIKGSQFEMLDYLFNQLENNDELFDDINMKGCIQIVCNDIKVDMLNLLLTHPKLLADDFLGQACIDASKNGSLEIFEYLFNKFLDNKIIKTKLTNGEIISNAASCGHIDVIRYVLNTENLKKYVDIHVNKDVTIRAAYKNNHFDILNYLVFDLQIEKTPFLEEYMRNEPELKKLFDIRDLNNSLNEELNDNQAKSKTIKI